MCVHVCACVCVCACIWSCVILQINTCFINLYSEYYNMQSMSQGVVVNPDDVSPSVVLLVVLNIKVIYDTINLYWYIDLFYASKN